MNQIESSRDRSSSIKIGVADLFSSPSASPASSLFNIALQRAAKRIECRVEVHSFAVNTAASTKLCGIEWPLLPEFDGLIVTGSEPRGHDIALEPVVPIIADLLDTSHKAHNSTLFSCQSAHAALYLLHGIKRSRLPDKKVGIYQYRPIGRKTLLSHGLPSLVPVPQSRWNTVPTAHLHNSSVKPILVSDDGEWHLAVGGDEIRHVFLQGHPEYLPDVLLREYRRDLQRFRDGRVRTPPNIPVNYLPPNSRRRIQSSAEPDEQDEAISFALQEFHDGTATAPWIESCDIFFANWLWHTKNRGQHVSLTANGEHR